MPIITLNECDHQVAHPSKPRSLKAGESADATEQWVKAHASLVRRGLIEVAAKASKPSAPKQCAAKTKSGKRCKRGATDGEFCATHAGS